MHNKKHEKAFNHGNGLSYMLKIPGKTRELQKRRENIKGYYNTNHHQDCHLKPFLSTTRTAIKAIIQTAVPPVPPLQAQQCNGYRGKGKSK